METKVAGTIADDVEGKYGVKEAAKFGQSTVIVKSPDAKEKVDVAFLGIEPGKFIEPKVTEGKQLTSEDKMGVIIDETLQEKASAIGNSLKFDLGGEVIVIDGKGGSNVVSQDDQDTDCTLKVSKEDLADLLSGKLNPMNAVMGGKVQIKGDMGVAMKLQSLLG